MKSKNWILGWLINVFLLLSVISILVYQVDPFMHYHAPNTDSYFYTLNNERSQNDGIVRHFNYDTLITGTSMTQNFKTTEMNALFSCDSIKVPFAGSSYKETGDLIKKALQNNPNLTTILCSLDMNKFNEDKDHMRLDLGDYPNYLYDDNPFNDIYYLWNKNVIWQRTFTMIANTNDPDFNPGITSFDDYSAWSSKYPYGKNNLISEEIVNTNSKEQIHLTEDQKLRIKENITQNIIDNAKQYPNVTFYYFFTPYSAIWWYNLVNSGTIYQQIEAEKYVIELLLEYDNIKLFSFNNRLDITTDLNNYKDELHYGGWINSLILKWMHDGTGLITNENYQSYIDEELNNYLTFPYESLNNQIDYECDLYAAALLNEELTEKTPTNLLKENTDEFELNKASIVKNKNDNNIEIECTGTLQRNTSSSLSAVEYIAKEEYIGAKITLTIDDSNNYLVFKGKKIIDHGQPIVVLLDENGNILKELSLSYDKLDNEWRTYVIDLSDIKGKVTIIFNGGYTDTTGSENSKYIFSDIVLY